MKYESFEPNGSFFMLNENTMLGQGDCLELMKHIPDGSVDMVLTDPPYGTTACKWDSVIPFELMWVELKRIIKPNGAIVLFGSQPFTTKLIASNIEQFKYCWYWEKEKAGNFQLAKKRAMKRIEEVCIFYKKQPTYNPQGLIEVNRVIKNNKTKNGSMGHLASADKRATYKQRFTNYPNDRLNFNNEKGLHESQKPVALLEYLIKTYTQENETVLDFTMGSGSTSVAAKNTNRKFIGIELSQNYFEIAKKRIQES